MAERYEFHLRVTVLRLHLLAEMGEVDAIV